MKSSWAMKAVCTVITALPALSFAAIDIDVTGASFQSAGKDTIIIKRLVVPGAGNWDVTFKWDAASLTFVPQAVSQSVASASLKLSGPTSVNESASITLAAVVQNADGSTASAAPSWSVSPASAGSISPSGVFTAASVTADVNAVATATFTHQGQPLTATYAFKVVNVPAPSRTCTGTLVNYRTETLQGEFAIFPENRKINVKLTSTLGTPGFYTRSFFLIQGTTTVDLSLYSFDADTAMFTPSNGWSGSGQIPAPGIKEGVIAGVPTSINLAQPFQIRYTDVPETTTSCN